MQDWTAVVPPTGAPGDRDWGRMAFEAAKERLEQCTQAEDCQAGECELEGHDGEDGSASCLPPAGAGIGCMACDDCTVREVLIAAWPIIEAAVRSGDFDLDQTLGS